MTTAAAPVQAAVYARLTADAELMGLVSGVYDHIPEAAPRPYVVIGEGTSLPDDAHDRRGLTDTLTLHVWSDYRGYRQAQQVMARVDALLDRQSLDVAGFTKVSIFSDLAQWMRDPDPDLRHGLARYQVWLEQPPE